MKRLNTHIPFDILGAGRKKFSLLYSLSILAVILAMTAQQAAAAAVPLEQTIVVDFSFDTTATVDKQVSGYRLYQDNTAVCESAPVEPQSFSCTLIDEPGTYDFTLTALYDDYSESAHSAPFPFTIADDVPLEGIGAGSKSFTFSWEMDPAADAAAHNFYLNDSLLCQSNDPAAATITCTGDLLSNQINYFTMTSVDGTGTESSPSNILSLDPADYPELFTDKLISFNWDYPAAEPATGFRVYHNNSFLCQAMDVTARQLQCQAELTTTNIFTTTAVFSDGSESNISNAIVYAPTQDAPADDTTALTAAIQVDNTTGEAPFTVNFDGSASSGAIAGYQWSFGDGETAGSAAVQHIYSYAGSYTARLTVTDANGKTSEQSVVITTTEPQVSPLATQPPTAVISSSTAIGEAPFVVEFDGGDSSTMQPPIASYSWQFGDGATAQGATTTHTYSSAGIYQATLTITDSSGLSDSISTPVLITAPSQPVNQQPIAAIALSASQGKAPLAISFSATGSSDPDGTIVQYSWNFGDGVTASGPSVQHTFLEGADYTVTLQVTDNGGLSASTSTLVKVLSEEDIEFAYELGELELDHQWSSVDLTQSFIDPVIISGPPTYAESQPVTVRLRNTTNKGFEIRLQEWDYLDGSHITELVNYLVMEQGAFTLGDGTRVEAGVFDATSSYQQIRLQHTYDTAPVILTQVITEKDGNAVTGRTRNVSIDGFEYKLQQQETTKTGHGTEKVAYIAWQSGSGEVSSGLFYEAGTTADIITHDWHTLIFGNGAPTLPFFYANMQTEDGPDTAALRVRNSSSSSIEVKVEEEQSKDSETDHTTEVVGYLLFAQESTSNEKLLTFTWEFDAAQEDSINGFRIYNDGTMICETATPSNRQLECAANINTTSNAFTIRAVDTSGTETNSSNSIDYTP